MLGYLYLQFLNMNKIKAFDRFWPILFITLVTIIFFYPVWLKGAVPLPADALVSLHVPWTELHWPDYPAGVPFKNGEITDSISQFYPWHSLVGEFWRSGKLPFWNFYMFSGTPLLATLHSAALYPLNVLYLFLSNIASWTALVILQIWLAGVFMYLFLRRLDLGKEASILGGLVFSFSGYMIAWLEFVTGGQAGLWLPLLLLFEINLLTSMRAKWLLPIAIVFFMIFSAGDFQVPLYSILVYLFFGLYLIGWENLKQKKFLMKSVFVIAGLVSGLLVSLPQLLPAFQLFSLSMRGADTYIKEYFFGLMDWTKITNFIWPDFYGNVTTGNYWARFGFNEYISFTGIVSIIFTAYGLITKKIKGEMFFFILLLVSLLFLFPTPFGFLPFKFEIPALSTSSASRIIFLVDFSLAVLCAYGFSKWKINKDNWLLTINFVFIFISTVVFLILVSVINTRGSFFGSLTPEMITNLKISLRNMAPTTIILFIFTGILIIKKYTPKYYLLALPILIVFLAAIELLRFSWKFVSFSPVQFVFPNTETITYLQNQQKPFRVAGGIPTNLFMPYQLSSAEGYDSLYPLRNAEWLSGIESGLINNPTRRYGLIHNFSSPLLNYNNVEYIIDYKKGPNGEVNKDGWFQGALLTSQYKPVFSENRVTVFQNTNVLPRVWFTTNYQVNNDAAIIIKELENLNNQKNKLVMIEQNPEILVENKDLSSGIFNYQEKDNQIDMNVKTSENSLLFVSQSYYPGWKAYVDNKEIKVLRSNYTFLSIAVPKGEHLVKFIYEPLYFKETLLVAAGTIIVLALFAKRK